MLSYLLGERKFKMVFEVLRGKKRNFLLGTAHFFPFSFKTSLEKLLKEARIVLFEGPLTERDMEYVSRRSLEEQKTGPSILDMIDRRAKEFIIREIGEARYPFDSNLPEILTMITGSTKSELESEIEGLKPWMAFFRIWVMFLRKKGWKHSVDLEAHDLAKKLGKRVHYLESLEEQIRALEGIPLERIISFLEMCQKWHDYTKNFVKWYLKGDLDRLMISTTSFPTRCESILDKRDPILSQRMLPFFEDGDALALVGVTHLRGILERLSNFGFEYRHVK